MQRLVVALESAYHHSFQSFHFFSCYLEVSDEEVAEIVFRQFEEQLVLVYGVSLIGDDEREVHIALRREFARLYRVTVAHHFGTSLPHIADVEFSAMQFSSGVHSVYNHSCQCAHFALRVFVHHGLHVVYATFGVTAVQLCHTVEENELVAVCTQWESCCRYLHVVFHLHELVSLEGIVCGGIQRVFQMHAIAGVLHEMRVGEQRRPFAVGESAFQLFEI